MLSTSEDVQYIGGCSVHRGCSVDQRDIMIHVGGYHEYVRGVFSTSERYHEYIGGDIMIYVGEQIDKSL